MKTMATKRLSLSTIMLCILLLAAACHRDEGAVTLTMSVESLSGGGKMTLNDNVSSWDTGDSVWVNGTAYAVSTDGGSTSVTVPYSDNGYRAIFPARIARNGGSEIVLPAEYHYRTNANGQLLDMPLVATSENSTLLFKHITGALMVKLRNDNGYSLSLDRIIVSSDRYALSGTRDTATANAPRTGTGNELNVSLCFDRQELTLNSGDSAYVMIPVAAVGSDNLFTITVRSHHEGTRYTATKTQSAGGSLSSNTLAHATMALDGTQIVSPLFEKIGSYYHIHTSEDFKNMVTAINSNWTFNNIPYSAAFFQIKNNIDMSDIIIEPITGYTGNYFNGNDNTISNLTIVSSTEICALFSSIPTDTKIQSLNLQGVRLISNGNADTRIISPLIGQLDDDNKLNSINIRVSEVTINGSPSGDIFFGGMVATCSDSIRFTNCHYSGNVTLSSNGKLYYGGIVGAITNNNNLSMFFTSCSSNGTNYAHLTSSSHLYAGGLIGDSKNLINNISKDTCTINFTLNSATRIFAGGLIGNLGNVRSDIKLTNDSSVKIAGIISYTGTPTYCYIGKIYGKGKSAYYLLTNRYNASELTIPLPNTDNNIFTNDPGNS